jgi:hypothetical protein
MTTSECIYVSIILQLLFEGEAKTKDLSPVVRNFLDLLIEGFEERPDDPKINELYYAANTMLEFDKEQLN